MKQRNLYLDFLRGLVSFSVIFIHTVFWSGTSYSPEVFRTITLLLDVPFFIFLSGWSKNYSFTLYKAIFNILKLWFHWMIFILLVDLFCLIIYSIPLELFVSNDYYQKIENIKPLLNVKSILFQLFFSVGDSLRIFPVIQGSQWFLPMYVMISICGTGIVNFFELLNIDKRQIILFILFLIIGLAYINTGINTSFFLLSQTFCFYMAIFLIGWYSPLLKIKTKWHYIIVIFFICILWFALGKLYGIEVTNLQEAKFPCHIMYFMASLLSITTAIYLRDRIKFNFTPSDNICFANKIFDVVCFIGRNSLCFYFTQGIGASIIFPIVKMNFKYGWLLTLIVVFFINLSITLVLGTLLVWIFKICDSSSLWFKKMLIKVGFF